MPRRFLFLAMGRAALGELTLGLRLAWELHGGGDEVVFLAPRALAPRFEGTPFKLAPIDPVYRKIDDLLPRIVREERCDGVVLVDLTSHLVACRLYGIGTTFPDRLDVPLAALDIWDLEATSRVWDTTSGPLILPPSPLDRARRLKPVPFLRPDTPGAYNALPAPAPATDRAAARAALGLAGDERLVILTTATWQAPPRRPLPSHDPLIAGVPDHLLHQLARLPLPARFLHVGAAPFPRADLLGARLRYTARLPAADFDRALAAADLLLSLNQAATSLGTALARRLPALTVVAPAWRVWPLGLHHFMTPLLDGNPYRDAVPEVHLGDLATTLTAELFDDDARAVRRAAIDAYVERVSALPAARTLLLAS